MVASVGNVDVAVFIHSHILRFAESRPRRWAAVAGEPRLAVTGDRVDQAGRRSHLANAIVVVIANVYVARAIYRDAYREIEQGLGRGASVSAETGLFRLAGDSADHALWSDLADRVVVGIGQVQVSRAIEIDAQRPGKPRQTGRAAVSGRAELPGAGDGRHHGRRRRGHDRRRAAQIV